MSAQEPAGDGPKPPPSVLATAHRLKRRRQALQGAPRSEGDSWADAIRREVVDLLARSGMTEAEADQIARSFVPHAAQAIAAGAPVLSVMAGVWMDGLVTGAAQARVYAQWQAEQEPGDTPPA